MTFKHFIGVYYMNISHVGPLWGLFRYPRGAQKGPFDGRSDECDNKGEESENYGDQIFDSSQIWRGKVTLFFQIALTHIGGASLEI